LGTGTFVFVMHLFAFFSNSMMWMEI